LLDFQALGTGRFAFSTDFTGLQSFNNSIQAADQLPGKK